MASVKFGVDFDYYLEIDDLKKLVLKCEQLGYDSAWIMDHLIWGESGETLECLTALGALASATSTIRLGSLVLCNSYRNPALLAKTAATLDIVSGGRLEFGIGAGWKEDEYKAYGYEFPSASKRIEQLREALTIITKMWTEERPSYRGKHYSISEAICRPKPIQKPHPPIWVGGGGANLLKVVAEFADGFNTVFTSPSECMEKIELLRKFCRKSNRDFDGIKKSWVGELVLGNDPQEVLRKVGKPDGENFERFSSNRLVGTPRQCVEKIEKYVEIGISHFILISRKFHEDLTTFAEEIIPSFR